VRIRERCMELDPHFCPEFKKMIRPEEWNSKKFH